MARRRHCSWQCWKIAEWEGKRKRMRKERGWKVDMVDRSFHENISMKDRCRGWIFVREIIPRITMMESWKNDEKKEADCSLLLLSDSTWKEPMFLDYTFIFIFLVLSIPSTCIKRYLPRCSPNYFRSLRHLIRHKISSFKDIEFK